MKHQVRLPKGTVIYKGAVVHPGSRAVTLLKDDTLRVVRLYGGDWEIYGPPLEGAGIEPPLPVLKGTAKRLLDENGEHVGWNAPTAEQVLLAHQYARLAIARRDMARAFERRLATSVLAMYGKPDGGKAG